ncbi:MAG: hypothetical protein JWM20_929 [Patescibacteria group bacterium]|nr:hypothetical protein [Patescibacteria group bacterium]
MNPKPSDNESWQEVRFDEVVASWLRDEWHYACYDKMRTDENNAIVNEPDLSDLAHNEIRHELLAFNRHPILDHLPTGMKWHSGTFTEKSARECNLISTTWCKVLSGGSLKLVDAVEHFHHTSQKINPGDKEKIISIKSAMAGKDPEDTVLVFVGESFEGPFTAIEGNHRLVATALACKESKSNLHFKKSYFGIFPNVSI